MPRPKSPPLVNGGRYIDVVLNVPVDQCFTYIEPDAPEGELPTTDELFGQRVEVPFASRKLLGVIVATHSYLPSSCTVGEEKIRKATRLLDTQPLLTRELYDVARFLASWCVAPIGECVMSMIPSGKREKLAASFPAEATESSFDKKALSEEQQRAVDEIASSAEVFHYVYGVTGSGKTEVFLSLAERTLAEGKSAIYLVPEISLTPQVVAAVRRRFGGQTALLHSALTPSQRLGEWKRILRGEARVVVGARSAVFAPVSNLGLVVIDEEHDSSYKAGSSPRYHARQVAMFRCKREGAHLVMGSATPSAEAWLSMQQGILCRHTLTRRLSGGEPPLIKCVDMNQESDRQQCISRELYAQMKRTLDEGKQVILFLNRRGFTHFFRCNSCGFQLVCANCSVPLTYHRAENRLRCHYCGYNVAPPTQCPQCGSLDTGYCGFGTEYIEHEVASRFPNARVLRVDADSLSKKGELEQKLAAFERGEADILLGTQMIAKGLNFPRLALVGVVLADTTLHLPDFRAAERTFALITQVAGRAGRFLKGAHVVVQSYTPSFPAIKLASQSKAEEFYRWELDARQSQCFPPYSRLVSLTFRCPDDALCERAADEAAAIIRRGCPTVELLGPAQCALAKVSGNWRYHILLRGSHSQPLRQAARLLLSRYKPPKDVHIEVDTDPTDLL